MKGFGMWKAMRAKRMFEKTTGNKFRYSKVKGGYKFKLGKMSKKVRGRMRRKINSSKHFNAKQKSLLRRILRGR